MDLLSPWSFVHIPWVSSGWSLKKKLQPKWFNLMTSSKRKRPHVFILFFPGDGFSGLLIALPILLPRAAQTEDGFSSTQAFTQEKVLEVHPASQPWVILLGCRICQHPISTRPMWHLHCGVSIWFNGFQVPRLRKSAETGLSKPGLELFYLSSFQRERYNPICNLAQTALVSRSSVQGLRDGQWHVAQNMFNEVTMIFKIHFFLSEFRIHPKEPGRPWRCSWGKWYPSSKESTLNKHTEDQLPAMTCNDTQRLPFWWCRKKTW